MQFEGVPQFLSVVQRHTPTAKNHKIQARQLLLPESKTLPDNPLDPISVNRSFQDFFCYCCSEAGMGLAIGQKQHGKISI